MQLARPLSSCIGPVGKLHLCNWRREGEPGINAKQPGIDRSKVAKDLHHRRLRALPDELVREDPAGRSTARLYVDHRTLTARPEGGWLTRRTGVLQDDTGRKLTKRNMLNRVRRVLSLGMWRRWRRRAGCGVPIGFSKFH